MNRKDDFGELWDALPEDVREELLKAAEESTAQSVEEFISEIFVGECPKCGSKATKDCEEATGIEDMTVGLCENCGYLWCTECGRSVEKGKTCEHWAVCEKCTEEKDEYGDCGLATWECEKVSVFEEAESDEPLHECAWCGGQIEREVGIFAVGAKARKGMKLKEYEGSILEMGLVHSEKTVPAIIPTQDSEAKRSGSDIIFLVCSRECGDLLKKALRKEKFTLV